MNVYGSSPGVLKRFEELPQHGGIIAEYVWIDAEQNVRSKCRTLPKKPSAVADVPEWNFDGSSTRQAPGHNSDVFLRPVAFYPCPFRRGDNIFVIAECWMPSQKPNIHNHRHAAAQIMAAHAKHDFWFGLEQEYTLLDPCGWPLGWPRNGFPAPQGPYYCGVGAAKVFGRDVVEAHYRACLYSGITISGTNAEVMPGQWEFQVGPVGGIAMGDQLWAARFLLHRVAEDFGIKVTFDPKPVRGDWNGAGMHTNVSTAAMRSAGGIKDIETAMEKLGTRHAEHMALYGENNDQRMTGKHETADYNKFSWGIANRGASVRVNRSVAEAGMGYFEDRRPASNADPYLVTGIIVETLCGKIPGVDMASQLSQTDESLGEEPTKH